MELADTSAWTSRHRDPRVNAEFETLFAAGKLATTDPIEFELLFGARTPAQFDVMRVQFAGFPRARCTPDDWARAADVWSEFVRRGRHRQIPHFDLLVAAVAERAGLPVLHYDRHFELIAAVTGQPVRALAPLGSLG